MLSAEERAGVYRQAIEQWKLAFCSSVLTPEEMADALASLGVGPEPSLFSEADRVFLKVNRISAE